MKSLQENYEVGLDVHVFVDQTRTFTVVNIFADKDAEVVDSAVVTILLDKLRATFEPTTWQQTLDALESDTLTVRRGLKAQLTTLELVMTSQVASLDTLTESDLIQAVQARSTARSIPGTSPSTCTPAHRRSSCAVSLVTAPPKPARNSVT